MLAYAANRPAIASRPSSPNALLLIIGAHVGLLALVMSMKMELPPRILNEPIRVKWYLPDPVKPEPQPVRTPEPQPLPHGLTQPKPIVPTTPTHQGVTDLMPPSPTGGAGQGSVIDPLPPLPLPEPPRPQPVSTGPKLLTPASELKPPYPQSKLLSEEQATLVLRLTVDEHGRVTAVDPVGSADPAFLASARRHIIAHWRYRPALLGQSAVGSSITVTLHFQLDD